MLTPPFLKPGDTIGLVSPAGKIDLDVVKNAKKFLSDAGFSTLVGQYALEKWHQFAGKDELRAKDLNEMLHNPVVRAIWCTRGGYGAIRLLGRVDFEILKKDPKWLIGFSDITVFHSLLQTNLGLKSIHGCMPLHLDGQDVTTSGFDALFQMLQNPIRSETIPFHPFNKLGKSKGELIGGNLTILHGLVGTPLDFNPKGKILFIEEVGEYLYSLDRMFQTMKLAGKFIGLEGLIVGQITESKDSSTPFGASAYKIVLDAVYEYNFPILFNYPAGHSNPNAPLMLGAEIELDIAKKSSSLIYIQ